jgi:hypothetical protein
MSNHFWPAVGRFHFKAIVLVLPYLVDTVRQIHLFKGLRADYVCLFWCFGVSCNKIRWIVRKSVERDCCNLNLRKQGGERPLPPEVGREGCLYIAYLFILCFLVPQKLGIIFAKFWGWREGRRSGIKGPFSLGSIAKFSQMVGRLKMYSRKKHSSRYQDVPPGFDLLGKGIKYSVSILCASLEVVLLQQTFQDLPVWTACIGCSKAALSL